MKYLVFALCFLAVSHADLRYSSKVGNGFKYRQAGVPANVAADGTPVAANAGTLPYRVPSTFGYKALAQQKKNNNDNFLRSNVDNEANQRNTAREAAQDMTPCREPDAGGQPTIATYQRGETVQLPLRWNNPHDSDCEINIWSQKMTKVTPIRRPQPCGGGYKNQRFSVTIPADMPGCDTPEEGCVMQLYGHSVEPRTYAMCTNFVLAGPAAVPAASNRRFLQNANASKSLPTAVAQEPVLYWDSFDTSHVDSDYSAYRGQQEQYIRDELRAAIDVATYVGNGGLVKTGDPKQKTRNQYKNRVDNAVKAAERKAKRANRAAQRALNRRALQDGTGATTCFEGDIYGVVNNQNCNRQYTNTYVTNVGYRAIMDSFAPRFAAAGLDGYKPKTKSTLATPNDPIGQYKRNGKPSQTPRGGKN